MLRKNIAPVVATILSGLLFIIIGSCFSAFFYKEKVIKVENPKLIVSGNIEVFDSESKEAITELKLSEMKLGLKPTTGEEDLETNIPITVTDQEGSEGQYAKFNVLAPSGAKIFITDVVIESDENVDELNKERENIMVAIKQIKKSATNLVEDKTLVGSLEPSEDKVELTFYVWLSQKAADVLQSSSISFKISLEP